jgi:superfamily II DNA or RNA helicase/SAM-dependent methyltransferase/SOS-response transcriptional repressor LexA
MITSPDTTHAYYQANAERFFRDTLAVDMAELQDRFLILVPPSGLILDAGCGSGRDSRVFLERGYRVSAFDAAQELAVMASRYIGQEVAVRTFADIDECHCYDGIWACASLLHLPESELPAALARLWAALKPGGIFYLSFKNGEGERRDDQGRHFTDATESRLRGWLRPLPDIDSIACWLTADCRPGRSEQWLNVLLRRRPPTRNKLVSGGEDNPFLPHLCTAINLADEIDLAVAFVKTTGLRLLLPDLIAALEGNEQAGRRPVRVRILTSDYLDVTDPEALRLLLLLAEYGGATVKVFQTTAGSAGFHLKAYIFARCRATGGEGSPLRGTAFIGSSNISRQALQSGLEWNYRVDYPGDDGFLEARHRFETLFAHPDTVELSDDWIDRYQARRAVRPLSVAPGSDEHDEPPTPTLLQEEALAALDATRRDGYRRGLVVMATGLGKTWLAAFDAEQCTARRVLFVAHREEILQQAAATFIRIRPRARVGFYLGQRRDTEVDLLFASVQTLARAEHLARFAADHFDYVVVDEFHHAAAATYRRLLRHFNPRFLLGLTATPERTDQSDILSLCDDNLVYSCNLANGINAQLLAPFHYYGIYDHSVDYREIPWRNGRFDPDALVNKLATLARARHALEQWRQQGGKRTLAFCVSVRHAEFMADHFSRAGVAAAAVYAGAAISRGDALARLRDNRLRLIFAVDLFNEGVDLPEIDTVMMLRPTDSKILFLQQLGRGLRRAEGKEHLVVLDFIGNHRGFLHKPQALCGVGQGYRQMAEFARRAEQQRLDLPAGCFVNYDLQLIEFMKDLMPDGAARDYQTLAASLGRRPTPAEYLRAGGDFTRVRRQYNSWFELVADQGDLSAEEQAVVSARRYFLSEIETTSMARSYKMVLLEAFQELDGWRQSPTLAELAAVSLRVIQRRPPLLTDLPDRLRNVGENDRGWLNYWRGNPVNAWIGGNLASSKGESAFFAIDRERFVPAFAVPLKQREVLAELVQELVDYRLAGYVARKQPEPGKAAEDRTRSEQALGGEHTTVSSVPSARKRQIIPLPHRQLEEGTELPYFPNLKIACGHFRTGQADVAEYRRLGAGYGRLDPTRHFIARATGNSMDGGSQPIRDGDYLLLERISPENAGSITGQILVIERQASGGDNQYLLRRIHKIAEGGYLLQANNPAYPDLSATEEMITRARLKVVINKPDDLMEPER